MIPILSAEQTRKADLFTIEHEPISSTDLMERASLSFVEKFISITEKGSVSIFAGVGNNGGDGLAIARILANQGWTIHVLVVGSISKATKDFKRNYERLKALDIELAEFDAREHYTLSKIVIDAIFGSGLSRPVDLGIYFDAIECINKSNSTVFSVDLPSGCYADGLPPGQAVYAHHTISFQLPKLSFFLPTLSKYVGEYHVVDISLDQNFIKQQSTLFFWTSRSDIHFPEKVKYSHKGSNGRLLIISGSRGKMGATTLCARAAMRVGGGLVFVHCPKVGLNVLQVNVPEVMVVPDSGEYHIKDVCDQIVDSTLIGPGLGTNHDTAAFFSKWIKRQMHPLVIDADGLNLLSYDKSLYEEIPEDSILTPHPKEFQRLVGEWRSDLDKLQLLRAFCQKFKVHMVLKGANSAVCRKDGIIFFNPTGNPGMATAGSGDVLAGIIAGLLVQGFSPFEALRNGVYLHGLAGDMQLKEKGTYGMIASDIVDMIPVAILEVQGI